MARGERTVNSSALSDIARFKEKTENQERRVSYSGRAFHNEEAFYTAWHAFLDVVAKGEYEKAPTYANFARWYGISTVTVYNTIARYPDLRQRIAESLADSIVEGAMAKKYDKTMSIFVLKNRCGWADKREDTTIQDEKKIATQDEAREKLSALASSLKA